MADSIMLQATLKEQTPVYEGDGRFRVALVRPNGTAINRFFSSRAEARAFAEGLDSAAMLFGARVLLDEGFADDPNDRVLQKRRADWRLNYIEAFLDLDIKNIGMTRTLASMTCSDAEAKRVVDILTDAREGDRVYPAREWLREQRASRAA